MEFGGLMLNVAGAGVGLLGAGVTVKIHGTKALSQADEHRRNVDVAIAPLDVQDELHRGGAGVGAGSGRGPQPSGIPGDEGD